MFGTAIESKTSVSRLRAATGNQVLHLLCDGGCRPNPGISQPVVHDGSRFLRVPSRKPSTNHRAVYAAVEFGLKHAIAVGAKEVRITILSKLVWGQIAGDYPSRILVLERDLCWALATKIPKVVWILSAPPLKIGASNVGSARALRKLAMRAVGIAPPAKGGSAAEAAPVPPAAPAPVGL